MHLKGDEVTYNFNCSCLDIKTHGYGQITLVFTEESYRSQRNTYSFFKGLNDLLLLSGKQNQIFEDYYHYTILNSGFKLEWKHDIERFGCVLPIQNPILSKKDCCILFNPIFCDQSDLNSLEFNEIIQKNPYDIEAILKLWRIKQEEQVQGQKQLNIYIFPTFGNFIMADQLLIPSFINEAHFITYIDQNTATLDSFNLNKIYFREMANNLSFKPFQFVEEGGKKVNLNLEYCLQNFDPEMIKKYLYKYKIKGNFVMVKKKTFYFIHCLKCQTKELACIQIHRILFPKDQKPRCTQCKLEIDVKDCDTLFYDREFYKYYESVIEFILSDTQISPVVYFLPIFYRFIQEQSINYIEFYTKKEPNSEEESRRFYPFYRLEYKISPNIVKPLNKAIINYDIIEEIE